MSLPTWLEKFKQWMEEPSPTGLWVYRGQLAKYKNILPVGFRDQNLYLLGGKNRVINHEIAQEFLPIVDTTLALWGIEDPYPLISDRMSPEKRGTISYREYIQALAKHYDFPTLFVDLTFNPIVAALFATHSFSNELDPGVINEEAYVYRWPGIRKGRIVVQIKHNTDEENELNITCLDLGKHILPSFLRPRNQSALVAQVMEDPFYLFPQLFPGGTPEHLLKFKDLFKFPSRQEFFLPAGAGHLIAKHFNMNPLFLFPNHIDFGYSFVNFVALFSMITPRDPELGTSISERLGALKTAGHFIMQREWVRLGQSGQTSSTCTLIDAKTAIESRIQDAIEAVKLSQTEEMKLITQEKSIKNKEDLEKELRHNVDIAIASYRKALGHIPKSLKTQLEGFASTGYNIQPPFEEHEMLSELEKRAKRVLKILQFTEMVPIKAFKNKKELKKLKRVLYSSDEYERIVNCLIKAQSQVDSLWLRHMFKKI